MAYHCTIMPHVQKGAKGLVHIVVHRGKLPNVVMRMVQRMGKDGGTSCKESKSSMTDASTLGKRSKRPTTDSGKLWKGCKSPHAERGKLGKRSKFLLWMVANLRMGPQIRLRIVAKVGKGGKVLWWMLPRMRKG